MDNPSQVRGDGDEPRFILVRYVLLKLIETLKLIIYISSVMLVVYMLEFIDTRSLVNVTFFLVYFVLVQ